MSYKRALNISELKKKIIFDDDWNFYLNDFGRFFYWFIDFMDIFDLGWVFIYGIDMCVRWEGGGLDWLCFLKWFLDIFADGLFVLTTWRLD